ncbi:MAG TPA: class I SAM-dependent methyltransferase [Mycobacteriales bacterium]|jgi:SAM-dependent methyltransferase|nr:class I SAM-dependent methyltransferase [Mycobacteriales bacterium]
MTVGAAAAVSAESVDAADARRSYWNAFYASARVQDVPAEPSRFGRWVHDRLGGTGSIVELGCGSGRDTFWFASQGHDVRAFDFAASAVARVTATAASRGMTVPVAELDLGQADDVRSAAASVLAGGAPDAVYARFLLHSLDDAGQEGLYRFAATTLSHGGLLFLEFRAQQDEQAAHLFGDDHFRAYLHASDVVKAVESFGGQVLEAETRQGWAPYRTEDPFVTRIVARLG